MKNTKMFLDLHHSISPVYILSRCIFSWPFKYKNGRIVTLNITEKLLAGIACVFHILWLIWSLHQRNVTQRVKINQTQAWLDNTSTVSATLLTLITILSVVRKQDVHVAVTFYKQLKSIDKMLQLPESVHLKCYTHLRNKVLIQILLVITVAIVDNTMWIYSIGILVSSYYFQSYAMYILNNVVTFQIDCKITLLKERFNVLNNRISEMLRGELNLKNQKNVQSLLQTQPTEETVRTFNKIFDALCDLIESINKSHGIQIIILAFTILTVVLNTLVIGFSLFRAVSYETEEIVCISMQFVWSAYYLILGMVLTSSTAATVRFGQTTSILSHKLLLEYSSRSDESETVYYTKEELKLLIEQVAYRNPTFSAAGFFIVDYTMLYAIIGAVTSYFIVLLQLP